MGIPVLVLGESGSGKSTSLRNFNQDEIGIFNVASKPLPFKNKLPVINKASYSKILKSLKEPSRKTYVIDDSQYLLSFELFDKSGEKGYDKFTDLAVNFYKLLKFISENTPSDVIVYLLHHTDVDSNGKTKVKTIGKMLDEKLTVEGLFSVVLLAENVEGEHYFRTKSLGNDTVKTPMGMFEQELIDNDLKFVDTTIRDYWNLNE